MTKDEKSQREIRKIAYGIWTQEGQPDGRDREHWEAAKEIWAFRSHDHALPDETGASDAETGSQTVPAGLTGRSERKAPRSRSMQ